MLSVKTKALSAEELQFGRYIFLARTKRQQHGHRAERETRRQAVERVPKRRQEAEREEEVPMDAVLRDMLLKVADGV